MSEPRRPGFATRMCVIVFSALVLAGIANTGSPARIPWMRNWSDYVSGQAQVQGMRVVTLTQTRTIIAAGQHIVFDARPLADFGVGHIPGALSLPSAEMETTFETFRMILTPDQPILVYCSGKECDESLQLGEFLQAEGFTNLVLFPGGYGEWQLGAQP